MSVLIGFPIVLMIVAGVIGAVVAVVRALSKGNGINWLALRMVLGFLGAVFFVVCFISVARVSRSSVAAVDQHRHAETVAYHQGSAASADEWLKQVDDTVVTRDSYISIQQLTTAMAAKVATACDQVGLKSERQLMADDVEPELMNAVAEAVEARNVSMSLLSDKRPANETWVTLAWQNIKRFQPSWSPTSLRSGQLVARISGPKGNSTISLTLNEKPWLDTPSVLPGQGYSVMTSGLPSSSREEAIRQLTQRIRNELASNVYSRARTSLASPPGYQAVYGQISSNTQRFEVDRVIVGIDRPVGRVWYAAALVNASPGLLDQVAHASADVTHNERAKWATLALALGGMMLVLAAVYAGLNAITRGYLRGHVIAGVTVAGIVMAVTILLLLKG